MRTFKTLLVSHFFAVNVLPYHGNTIQDIKKFAIHVNMLSKKHTNDASLHPKVCTTHSCLYCGCVNSPASYYSLLHSAAVIVWISGLSLSDKSKGLQQVKSEFPCNSKRAWGAPVEPTLAVQHCLLTKSFWSFSPSMLVFFNAYCKGLHYRCN